MMEFFLAEIDWGETIKMSGGGAALLYAFAYVCMKAGPFIGRGFTMIAEYIFKSKEQRTKSAADRLRLEKRLERESLKTKYKLEEGNWKGIVAGLQEVNKAREEDREFLVNRLDGMFFELDDTRKRLAETRLEMGVVVEKEVQCAKKLLKINADIESAFETIEDNKKEIGRLRAKLDGLGEPRSGVIRREDIGRAEEHHGE